MNSQSFNHAFGNGGRQTRLGTAAGFSLVEVTLAIAVVAIGLVGILAVFPLGLNAARTAADTTQMASVAQDEIAYWQQEAANTNDYSSLPSAVIDSASSYGTNVYVDGIWYGKQITIANSGYSSIGFGSPSTNMISRISIAVWRTTTNLPSAPATSATNYYITEVARYVQ